MQHDHEEVIEHAKNVFIQNEFWPESARASGGSFEIDNPDDWVLEIFIKDYGFQPSNLHLYLLYNPKVVCIIVK